MAAAATCKDNVKKRIRWSAGWHSRETGHSEALYGKENTSPQQGGDKLLDKNAYLAWQDLVENHLKLTQSLKWFFSTEVDRIEVLRHGLQKGHIPAVLYAIAYMDSTEISELLNELVWFATSHGYAQAIHKIVVSLPRQVITEKVVPVIEKTLSGELTDDEYRRILELCAELDRKLACRLAQKALLHPNIGIREAGEDVIQSLACDKILMEID